MASKKRITSKNVDLKDGDAMWDFVQNEILGMQWLNRLIGRLLSLAGLDMKGRIGGSMYELKLKYNGGEDCSSPPMHYA